MDDDSCWAIAVRTPGRRHRRKVGSDRHGITITRLWIHTVQFKDKDSATKACADLTAEGTEHTFSVIPFLWGRRR